MSFLTMMEYVCQLCAKAPLKGDYVKARGANDRDYAFICSDCAKYNKRAEGLKYDKVIRVAGVQPQFSGYSKAVKQWDSNKSCITKEKKQNTQGTCVWCGRAITLAGRYREAEVNQHNEYMCYQCVNEEPAIYGEFTGAIPRAALPPLPEGGPQ